MEQADDNLQKIPNLDESTNKLRKFIQQIRPQRKAIQNLFAIPKKDIERNIKIVVKKKPQHEDTEKNDKNQVSQQNEEDKDTNDVIPESCENANVLNTNPSNKNRIINPVTPNKFFTSTAPSAKKLTFSPHSNARFSAILRRRLEHDQDSIKSLNFTSGILPNSPQASSTPFVVQVPQIHLSPMRPIEQPKENNQLPQSPSVSININVNRDKSPKVTPHLLEAERQNKTADYTKSKKRIDFNNDEVIVDSSPTLSILQYKLAIEANKDNENTQKNILKKPVDQAKKDYINLRTSIQRQLKNKKNFSRRTLYHKASEMDNVNDEFNTEISNRTERFGQHFKSIAQDRESQYLANPKELSIQRQHSHSSSTSQRTNGNIVKRHTSDRRNTKNVRSSSNKLNNSKNSRTTSNSIITDDNTDYYDDDNDADLSSLVIPTYNEESLKQPSNMNKISNAKRSEQILSSVIEPQVNQGTYDIIDNHTITQSIIENDLSSSAIVKNFNSKQNVRNTQCFPQNMSITLNGEANCSRQNSSNNSEKVTSVTSDEATDDSKNESNSPMVHTRNKRQRRITNSSIEYLPSQPLSQLNTSSYDKEENNDEDNQNQNTPEVSNIMSNIHPSQQFPCSPSTSNEIDQLPASLVNIKKMKINPKKRGRKRKNANSSNDHSQDEIRHVEQIENDAESNVEANSDGKLSQRNEIVTELRRSSRPRKPPIEYWTNECKPRTPIKIFFNPVYRNVNNKLKNIKKAKLMDIERENHVIDKLNKSSDESDTDGVPARTIIKRIKKDTIEICFYNKNEGYMTLPPRSRKNLSKAKYKIKFEVLSGVITTEINSTKRRLVKFGRVTVEEGSLYKIRNITDTTSKVLFVKQE